MATVYLAEDLKHDRKEITGRSDIYSLDSVLYEMLAGEPPHVADAVAQALKIRSSSHEEGVGLRLEECRLRRRHRSRRRRDVRRPEQPHAGTALRTALTAGSFRGAEADRIYVIPVPRADSSWVQVGAV